MPGTSSGGLAPMAFARFARVGIDGEAVDFVAQALVVKQDRLVDR